MGLRNSLLSFHVSHGRFLRYHPGYEAKSWLGCTSSVHLLAHPFGCQPSWFASEKIRCLCRMVEVMHTMLTIYLSGLCLMSWLMLSYYIITRAMKSVGEPVWKLVWTAVIWPAVAFVIIYQWLYNMYHRMMRRRAINASIAKARKNGVYETLEHQTSQLDIWNESDE